MVDQAPKSAAEEFAALREEVAVQRRAIERLLNERGVAPDYTETLGKMMRDLKEASKSLTWLVNRPSMQATPEVMANQIVMAGDQARKQDRDIVTEATRALTQATRDIQNHVAKAREAGRQNRRLRQVGLGAAGVGVMVGLLIAIGMLDLLPEHGAAWILGLGRWEAGQRLMASANSEAWSEIEYAGALLQHNRSAVTACRAEAERKKTRQPCRIVVEPVTVAN